MRFLIICVFLFPFLCFAQRFEPIPHSLKASYQFNLSKNFFPDEAAYYKRFASLSDSLNTLNVFLKKNRMTAKDWVKGIREYSGLEASYRVIDLYLFLRFARNMNDTKADIESDSLRNNIRKTRLLIKQKITALTMPEVSQILKLDKTLSYYINSIQKQKIHLTGPEREKVLQPYAYTRSSVFYSEAVRNMRFEKLKTPSGEIDVIKERSAWESNPDTSIQKLGQQYVFNGYEAQKDFIGYHYIEFIKGINAYSVAKNYIGFTDEKLHEAELSDKIVQSFFAEVVNGAKQKRAVKATDSKFSAEPLRFTIQQATNIIENALGVLGEEYKKQLSDLLNPVNGRIDLGGDGNRIPIRGTASVYPIYPSIFYALNYEGYLIDLTLLSHEAGHAVQASLMYENKVPLIYAAGPAYFTESFGKFNELLLFDYQSSHEKDTLIRKIYANELKNKIDVLFGSTLEAYVEYSLISGIVAGTIKNPDDLDSITQKKGSDISPELFQSIPEYNGLWMVLETNYQAPLHNVNDMIAAALAIKYYQLYKKDPKNFAGKYIALLKKGYDDSPANLLKQLGINLQDESFIKSVVDFAVRN